MRKILFLLLLIIISIMIFSEPYKPYPVLTVHGYNTDNYGESNFGIVMQSDHDQKEIDYPIASSPVKIEGEEGLWYVSRNEGKRIEYDKLSYHCAEYNREILDYWAELADDDINNIYWIENDNTKYKRILPTDSILPQNPDDISVSQPINCFLETIEFDWPGIGSADERYPNSIDPTPYQIGRGRQLLCKFKETLINYYTDGEPYFVEEDLEYEFFTIKILFPVREVRTKRVFS